MFCVTSLICDVEDKLRIGIVNTTLVMSSLLLATVVAGKLDHAVAILEGVNVLGPIKLKNSKNKDWKHVFMKERQD